MADLGLLGIKVDPEYGGAGLDWWSNVAFIEGGVVSKRRRRHVDPGQH